MKRILKKRSVKRLNAIFKKGRTEYPKDKFPKLVFIGMGWGLYEAFKVEGCSTIGSLTFSDEAIWGE